ncbi:MAG: hypothetical protein ACK6DM_04380 [Alphaproteobacteria bacterium]|jgi:hypothetical protein
MTTHTERAEQLLALATRLTSVLEEDAAILRSRRPAQLAGRQQDRDILMLQYTKAVGEFRKAHVKGSLPPALRQKLATATEKLMAATREHSRLLLRFRHVTEGMLKAVANVVVAQETPAVYAKTGAISNANTSHRASALTLNQAV